MKRWIITENKDSSEFLIKNICVIRKDKDNKLSLLSSIGTFDIIINELFKSLNNRTIGFYSLNMEIHSVWILRRSLYEIKYTNSRTSHPGENVVIKLHYTCYDELIKWLKEVPIPTKFIIL